MDEFGKLKICRKSARRESQLSESQKITHRELERTKMAGKCSSPSEPTGDNMSAFLGPFLGRGLVQPINSYI